MAVQPRVDVSHSASLAARLAPLRDEAVALWRATPPDLPDMGPQITWRQRWGNARATRLLIHEIARRVEAYPSDESERAAWRDDACDSANLEKPFRMAYGYRRLRLATLLAPPSLRATRARIRSLVVLDDLWQSLRTCGSATSSELLGVPSR